MNVCYYRSSNAGLPSENQPCTTTVLLLLLLLLLLLPHSKPETGNSHRSESEKKHQFHSKIALATCVTTNEHTSLISDNDRRSLITVQSLLVQYLCVLYAITESSSGKVGDMQANVSRAI